MHIIIILGLFAYVMLIFLLVRALRSIQYQALEILALKELLKDEVEGYVKSEDRAD